MDKNIEKPSKYGGAGPKWIINYIFSRHYPMNIKCCSLTQSLHKALKTNPSKKGFSPELSLEFRSEQREVSSQTKKKTLPIISDVSVGSGFIQCNKWRGRILIKCLVCDLFCVFTLTETHRAVIRRSRQSDKHRPGLTFCKTLLGSALTNMWHWAWFKTASRGELGKHKPGAPQLSIRPLPFLTALVIGQKPI